MGLTVAQCDLDKDLQHGSLHSYEGLVSQVVFRVFIIHVLLQRCSSLYNMSQKAEVSTVQMWTDKLHR